MHKLLVVLVLQLNAFYGCSLCRFGIPTLKAEMCHGLHRTALLFV